MILNVPNFAVINFGLIASLFAAAAILFYLLLGVLRGGERAGLRLGIVAVDAVLSFLFVRLAGYATVMPTAIGVLRQLEENAEDAELLGTLLSASSTVLWALVAPFVFFAAFLLFGALLWVLYLVFALAVFPKKRYADGTAHPRRRLLGAALGVMTGVLVFVSLNLPFYGYEKLIADNAASVNAVADNGITVEKKGGLGSGLSRLCGSDAVFDAMTSLHVGGERIPLVSELSQLVGIGADVRHLSESGTTIENDPVAYIAIGEKLTRTRIVPVFVKLAIDNSEILLVNPQILSALEESLTPGGVAALRTFLGDISGATTEELAASTALALRLSAYALSDNPTVAEGREIGSALAADPFFLSAVKNGVALVEALLNKEGSEVENKDTILSICKLAAASPEETLMLVELIPAGRAFALNAEQWDNAQLVAVDEIADAMTRSALLRALAVEAVPLVDKQVGQYAHYRLLSGLFVVIPEALSSEEDADHAVSAVADISKAAICSVVGEDYGEKSATTAIVRTIATVAIENPALRENSVAGFNELIDKLNETVGLPADRFENTHIHAEDLELSKPQVEKEAELFAEILTVSDKTAEEQIELAAKLCESEIFSQAVDEIIRYNAEEYASATGGGDSLFAQLPDEIRQYAHDLASKKITFAQLPDNVKDLIIKNFPTLNFD